MANYIQKSSSETKTYYLMSDMARGENGRKMTAPRLEVRINPITAPQCN